MARRCQRPFKKQLSSDEVASVNLTTFGKRPCEVVGHAPSELHRSVEGVADRVHEVKQGRWQGGAVPVRVGTDRLRVVGRVARPNQWRGIWKVADVIHEGRHNEGRVVSVQIPDDGLKGVDSFAGPFMAVPSGAYPTPLLQESSM